MVQNKDVAGFNEATLTDSQGPGRRIRAGAVLGMVLAIALIVAACTGSDDPQPLTQPDADDDVEASDGGDDPDDSDDDSEDEDEDSEQTTTTVDPDVEAALDTVIEVSTTAPADDQAAINEVGESVVTAWWFNESGETYGDLADRLLDEGLITQDMAAAWRANPAQAVEDRTGEVEIVSMNAVRVEPDNASFQISSSEVGEDEETLTFLEFILVDGMWKVTEVA